jgi:hypothetical protein
MLRRIRSRLTFTPRLRGLTQDPSTSFFIFVTRKEAQRSASRRKEAQKEGIVLGAAKHPQKPMLYLGSYYDI